MTKKRSVQADKVRPFAGQPFAFVDHSHPGVTDIISDHAELLAGIGVNTHDQIDTHLADATKHFLMSAISITESQISDLGSYAAAVHNHDSSYLAITAASALTLALKSATTTIDVSSATAPTVGQVLTATGDSDATWQTPAVASTGNIVQTGTPLATHLGYFTADKNLSGDAGLTWITASARLNISGAAPVLRLHDNDNAASSMTTKVEFYDNTPALVGEIGYLLAATASLSIKTTLGGIILNTSGSAHVVITGDGDIAIGGYINGYAGSPADGSVLMWVTANAQAEFTLGVMMNAGTPVDNQIAVFSAEAVIEGDANFTWDGTDFAAGTLAFTGANSQVVLGDGTLAVPGIAINGSATATPYINLQQNSVTRAVFRFSDSADRAEISSTSDEITLRPGNVDTLVVSGAVTTLNSPFIMANQKAAFVGVSSGWNQSYYTMMDIANMTAIGSFNSGLVGQLMLSKNLYDDTLGIYKSKNQGWASLLTMDTGGGISFQRSTVSAAAADETLTMSDMFSADGTTFVINQNLYVVGDQTVTGTLDVDEEVIFTEQVDHLFTPAATRGILWVKNDIPNTLIFTDDAGTDWVLNLAEVNDLSSVVTWANVPDANITESSVTQHEAMIDHDALLNFNLAEHFTAASISIPLTQINDVTAVAAEVNLLDLSGLTAGWVLSADTATTASWKEQSGVENTYSPTLRGVTTDPTQSYLSNTGSYVKIGNIVTVTGLIIMAASGITAGAGQAFIGDLPFNISVSGAGSIGGTGAWAITNTGAPTHGGLPVSGTTMVLYTYNNDAGKIAGTTACSAADIKNLTSISFTATYITDE